MEKVKSIFHGPSLQKRRSEPRDRHRQTLQERSLPERSRVVGFRLIEVSHQHRLDLLRERLVEEQRVHFELKSKRPVVEIGATDRGYVVVHEEDLLVHEAWNVPIEANPHAVELLREPQRRKICDEVIGFIGNDDTNVHAPHRSEAKRRHHRLIRHKVRRRDPDSLFRGVDGVEEKERGRLEFIGGAHAEYQGRHVVCGIALVILLIVATVGGLFWAESQVHSTVDIVKHVGLDETMSSPITINGQVTLAQVAEATGIPIDSLIDQLTTTCQRRH